MSFKLTIPNILQRHLKMHTDDRILYPCLCLPFVPPTAEVTKKPVDATVTGIGVKTFSSGEVSWSSIGFSKAGMYYFKFHAKGELSGSKFAISSDTAILEVLPTGRPATMHILQEPGNAAPVSERMK